MSEGSLQVFDLSFFYPMNVGNAWVLKTFYPVEMVITSYTSSISGHVSHLGHTRRVVTIIESSDNHPIPNTKAVCCAFETELQRISVQLTETPNPHAELNGKNNGKL